MKTYLCDKITRINISKVSAISNGMVTLKNVLYQFDSLPDISSAIFTEETQSTDAGMLYIQKLTITANIPNDVLTDLNDQPQIFKLRFSDGNADNVWGTIENPVTCSKTRGEKNIVQMEFDRHATRMGF